MSMPSEPIWIDPESPEGIDPETHEAQTQPPAPREDPAAPIVPNDPEAPYYPPGPLGVTLSAPVQLAGPVATQEEPPDSWNTWRTGAADNPTQVVGRMPGRLRLDLVNLGPDTIYLGPDNSVSPANGLHVASGGSATGFTTTAEFWGVCAAGDTAELLVIVQYRAG